MELRRHDRRLRPSYARRGGGGPRHRPAGGWAHPPPRLRADRPGRAAIGPSIRCMTLAEPGGSEGPQEPSRPRAADPKGKRVDPRCTGRRFARASLPPRGTGGPLPRGPHAQPRDGGRRATWGRDGARRPTPGNAAGWRCTPSACCGSAGSRSGDRGEPRHDSRHRNGGSTVPPPVGAGCAAHPGRPPPADCGNLDFIA